jgi:hypothetical protein
VAVRKQKAETRYEDNIRKKAKRAAIRDHAETILHTSLVTSIAEFETQMQARSTSAGARISFMKEQFHARVSGETSRDYRGLGPEFRGVHGKLKLTPSDGKTGISITLSFQQPYPNLNTYVYRQGGLSSGTNKGYDS